MFRRFPKPKKSEKGKERALSVEQRGDQFYMLTFALLRTLLPCMRKLITEVTTLKTGLAEGIFVKHALSRLDCVK